MAVKPWKGAMHAPSDRKILFFYSIYFSQILKSITPLPNKNTTCNMSMGIDALTHAKMFDTLRKEKLSTLQRLLESFLIRLLTLNRSLVVRLSRQACTAELNIIMMILLALTSQEIEPSSLQGKLALNLRLLCGTVLALSQSRELFFPKAQERSKRLQLITIALLLHAVMIIMIIMFVCTKLRLVKCSSSINLEVVSSMTWTSHQLRIAS